MKYAIGLDVGIASVGYSVLELDGNDNPYRIVKLGSRIFEKREVNRDGDTLTAERRGFRCARRTVRRRKHRKERIRNLIVSAGLLSREALDDLYEGKELSDVYGLRVKALDARLTNEEFSRVLIHIAQRRGFKSNRKADDSKDSKSDNAKMLGAIAKNRELCEVKGYRTVGEMLYHAEQRRNRAGGFECTVDRASIEAEVHLIFLKQREYLHPFATEENEAVYCDILLGQRSFADGPACGPYAGNQVDKMRGNCTFEKEEPRAAKATYSFQLFNLWQHINHIRVHENSDVRALSDEERRLIFDMCHKKKTVTYTQIRKLLQLSDDALFKGVTYAKGSEIKTAEDKAKLNDLAFYHKVKSTLDDMFLFVSREQLDLIGTVLSKNYSDEEITRRLLEADISPAIIDRVLTIENHPKNGHLSLKALYKIIPYLEVGMTYDKACAAAGYDFKAENHEKLKYLPGLEATNTAITNPVVKRAVSQTIKVVNAIIREMHSESPVYLNIELARELSKNFEERGKIEKMQQENAAQNERMMNELRSLGVSHPTGFDLVKYKLWKEQGEVCAYSGTKITFAELMDARAVEVDHIVPYSKCFDDRMVNKVLVRTSENRNKSNRLPLQYLTGEKRDRFLIWVKNSQLKANKKALLLKEKISDEAEWKMRNLQDTQYLSRFLYGYIQDYLQFSPFSSGKKRHVYAVNGMITSVVRARWGIRKVRADGDMHHAVDATVVGCISQGMINEINRYARYEETRYAEDFLVDAITGEVIEKSSDVVDKFPRPWPWFLDELTIRLCQEDAALRKQLNDKNFPNYAEVDLDSVKAPFVSRMCRHKIKGAANKATVYSGKLKDDGYLVSKVPLTKLKWKNGQIEGYYNDSDPVLYSILADRLIAFGGDAEKAFAEPVYKPSKKGGVGTLVTSVKIRERISSFVEVHGGTGITANGDMIRVDVFYVEGDGYYFVPIYVHDTVKAELPKLAPTQNKDKGGGKIWKEMDDSNFQFSLYPNDLIKIYSNKEIVLSLDDKLVKAGSTLPKKKIYCGREGVFLYNKGLNISTALMSGLFHDGTYWHISIGKTIQKIEKYEVDVLGNVRLVGKEKRQSFSQKRS